MIDAHAALAPELEHLAWSLHGPSRGPRILLMLHFFGDESHDERRKVILTVAGLMAPTANWDRLTDRWKRAICAAGIKVFHAADCQAAQGEFRGWSEKRIECLQRALVDLVITQDSDILAYSSAVNMAAYDKIRPRLKPLLKLPSGHAVSGHVDDPYIMLFQQLLAAVSTEEWLKPLPAEERVGFTFDRQHLKARAQAIGGAMHEFVEYQERFGGVAFDDKAKIIPLQIADLYAYEKFRFHDGVLRGLPERWQHKELWAKWGRREVYMTEDMLNEYVERVEKLAREQEREVFAKLKNKQKRQNGKPNGADSSSSA